MECMRCQGLMAADHFLDLQGTGGLMWMKGWRCLNCGHVVDPLIEQNRCLQGASLLVMAEAPTEFATEEVHHRGQGIEKAGPIRVVPHDRLALVAPCGDMIDAVRKRES